MGTNREGIRKENYVLMESIDTSTLQVIDINTPDTIHYQFDLLKAEVLRMGEQLADTSVYRGRGTETHARTEVVLAGPTEPTLAT